MRVLYDADLDPTLIKKKTVAILGYGNQGHAHGLNLRDSGVPTIVGARAGGQAFSRALSDGFQPMPIFEAVGRAEVLMLLAPDEAQAAIYQAEIAPTLRPGQALGFAHGFAIHFGLIAPPAGIDVFMAAPMGAGALMRREFVRGAGVPSLIAVARDASGAARALALSYAGGIGGGRAGIIETTFKEECETDLFAEQAVLCGGLTNLMRTGFEVLVEAGYGPEMAYFSVVHELRFIVDLIQERGLAGMRDAISNTARYGDLTRGPRFINAEVKAHMKAALGEIQSGQFAREWMAESQSGLPKLKALDAAAHAHPIEAVGEQLRQMMRFLPKPPK